MKKLNPHARNVWVENKMTTEFLETYHIGSHIGKQKTLAATVASFPELNRPYQIFLSGPLGSSVNANDEDVAATAATVADINMAVFVHSAYIINLAGPKNIETLKKTLTIAAAMGASGVVVHVGKSVGKTAAAAIEVMRTNLTECLEYATAECPILLETPAGQGTELLTKRDDFVRFVNSFADPRIAICVDTCHVFASGISPADYIRETLDAYPDLIQLVHFNDSQTEKGSKIDRHSFVGTGKIGMEGMTEVANICREAQIPMVIE